MTTYSLVLGAMTMIEAAGSGLVLVQFTVLVYSSTL